MLLVIEIANGYEIFLPLRSRFLRAMSATRTRSLSLSLSFFQSITEDLLLIVIIIINAIKRYLKSHQLL